MDAPEGSLIPMQTAIEDRVKQHPRMKGVLVVIDGVNGGESTVTDGMGRLIPYVVLTWGGRSATNAVSRGITGTRRDLKKFSFGGEVYAKDSHEVQRVEADLVDILEGWEPPNGGEITVPYAAPVTNPLELKQGHIRIGRGLIFECLANTTFPDSTVG